MNHPTDWDSTPERRDPSIESPVNKGTSSTGRSFLYGALGFVSLIFLSIIALLLL
jgi:hypothetical protein